MSLRKREYEVVESDSGLDAGYSKLSKMLEVMTSYARKISKDKKLKQEYYRVSGAIDLGTEKLGSGNEETIKGYILLLHDEFPKAFKGTTFSR
jgi:hypothetical protein